MVRAAVVVALASCVACSSAFVVPSARASSRSALRMMDDRSQALPMDKRPPALDGTLPGDVGFDPAGFTNNPPRKYFYGGGERSLKWFQEAEIVHGRVAMIAALGWVFPSIYHWPGNAEVGLDAYANTNPLLAYSQVPQAAVLQIIAAVSVIEHFRIARVIRGDAPAGDLGLGQGEGRWNPFGFKYSDEEYREKQVQEIKNGRLAMVAIIGLISQASVTGQGIVDQLGGGLATPDAVSKAGYFIPGVNGIGL